ncbi:gram-negative pili assembly chaperone, N-terminal domain protein [Pseudomonas fluorescens]|uniref:Gram-negative pili assembly chaperone, N-terminal domain protein n=1 Tax=Pseudomonas fluorescens TaxID=294 RepID=A0A379IDY2_PSEFL|nr:molecular chaperone [Pseudomonas fluorescens]SUD31045.1 gram-negative pili assembly chaperone, N-terminal domain protein [Pseudomonas fluorescens]
MLSALMSPLKHWPTLRTCRSLLLIGALVAALLALTPCAQATLKVEGTRLIYFGQYKEASINIVNQSSGERVVQSWVTREDDDATLPVPFAVVQPLVRLDAQQHHLLRILYAGEGLPSDAESMFLLNVMEIPLKPHATDSVQFAVRQRLKLFYRPPGLAGSSSEAVPQLVWRRAKGPLVTVTNPSAFHLSLVDVQVDSGGQVQALEDYVLLKPGERKVFSTHAPIIDGSQINFTEITDIGLQARHRAALK